MMKGRYTSSFTFREICLVCILTIASGIGCKPPPGAGPIQTQNKTPDNSNIAASNVSALNDGCTPPAACPKADINFELNGAQASTVNAQVGTQANLAFAAKSSQFPGRVFAIYMIEPSPLVSSMSVQGNRSSAASMRWSPYGTDPQSGSIRIIARDMTACQKLSATNPAECTNFNTKLDAYDSEKSISWSLSGSGNTSQGSSNSSGGLGGLGSILGVLTGVLGGGGGANPLGALGGLLGGGLGGGQAGGAATQTNFCSAQNCGACNQQQCLSLQNQTPGCQFVNNICTRR